MPTEKTFAVFYDAENISPYSVPKIYRFLQSKGNVKSQEAHGDYSMDLMSPWNEMVLENVPVKLIHKPHNGRKEVADKSLMNEISAWPIGHQGETIVIVTSDNDFVETSSVLRSYGVEVIGIGTRHQSKPNWISSCSTFYFIEDIKYDAVGDTQPASLEPEQDTIAEETVPVSDGYVEEEPVQENSEEQEESEEHHGTVYSLRPTLNCGFIREGSDEYYFSYSDAVDDDGCTLILMEGDEVTFRVSRPANPLAEIRKEQTGKAACVRLEKTEEPQQKGKTATGKVYFIPSSGNYGFIGIRGATCRKEFYFSFDDVEGFDGCNPPVYPGDTVEFTIARNFNPSLADYRARTGQAKLVKVV